MKGIDFSTNKSNDSDALNELLRILDENPNPIINCSDAGQITFLNSSAKVLFPEIAKNPELPFSLAEKLCDVLKNKGFTQFTFENESSTFQVKAKPLDDGKVIFYFADVTTFKAHINDLAQSARSYKHLIESANDIIYKADYLGSFTYINKVSERITGYSEFDLLGQHFSVVVKEDWRDDVNNFYKQQFNSREKITYLEFPIITKNNKEIWVGQNVQFLEENGRIIEFTAVVRDITEKKRMMAELEQSEEKYRSILENMDLGLIEMDTSGKIIKCYPHFALMLGEELLDLHGTSIKDYISDEKNFELYNLHHTTWFSGKSSVFEIKLYSPKMRTNIWALLSGTPIFDTDGKVDGALVILYDISERKRTEQELLKARYKAEESSRAKELFLANMSHEIRTPMNAISGIASLLKKTAVSDLQKNYLEAIVKSSDNLLVIINDILDFSKIESGKMELEYTSFSLTELSGNLNNIVGFKAEEKSIIFKSKIDPEINEYLIGDPVRLNQILINLVNNAIKFTEKGSIEFSCSLIEKLDNHDIILFRVKDSGIGIHRSKLGKIFESFTQEDGSITRKYGGTGLGLSITKTLVELFGGEIKVHSQKDEGATFYFTLKFTHGEEPVNQEAEIEENSYLDYSDLKLLLVEDHQLNQLVVKTILEERKIDLDIAHNGKEAIEMIKSKEYDLILMDIQMPIMGGVEATEIIRNELFIETPIIALTANAFKKDKELYLNSGMDAYLSKPFQEEELFFEIRRIVGDKIKVIVDKNKESSDLTVQKPLLKEKSNSYYSFSHLYNISNGNEEFVRSFINTFLETVPKLVEDLRESLKAKDINDAARKVHKIRPSMDALRIDATREVLIRLEKALISDFPDQKIYMKWANQFFRIFDEIIFLLRTENNLPS